LLSIHLMRFVIGSKVILLVTEGLTESLLSKVATPAIDALVTQGAVAGFKPEFPSSLLPSLQAMVTGQHSERTGVIDREVVDENGELLHYDTDPEFWNYNPNLTAIWDLNKEVAGHKTGCIQWPGTEVQLDYYHCDSVWKYEDYDIVTDVSSISNTTDKVKRSVDQEENKKEKLIKTQSKNVTKEKENNVDNIIKDEFFFNKTTDKEWLMWENQIKGILKWFSDEKDPMNFVLFNVYQPSICIQTYGPDSLEADQALQKVDQMIALLVEKLKLHKLFEDVNIIITGIHGYVDITADKVVDITQYIPDPKLIVGHSPVLNIQHTEKNDLPIYTNLLAAQKDKFDIYIQNSIPDRFHYKHNDRVGAITLVAKETFAFSDVWKEFKKLDLEHKRPESLSNHYGLAGYDNDLDSMQSIIILHGPGIQRSKTPDHIKPIINAVDVFPLLSHLLELPDIPNNGSLKTIRSLLKYPPSQSIEAIKKVIENYISGNDKLPNTVIILACSTVAVLLLICCGACAIRRRNKNLGKLHNYKYSSVKHNRRSEGREDGSENNDDKVGLLTSAIMEEELEDPDNLPV